MSFHDSYIEVSGESYRALGRCFGHRAGAVLCLAGHVLAARAVGRCRGGVARRGRTRFGC